MDNQNQYAVNILESYNQTSHQLVNTYCQLKDKHPYDSFAEFARAIWRAQMLVEIWQDIAAVLEGDPDFYYGENDYEDRELDEPT
jgi:hypothetical protein